MCKETVHLFVMFERKKEKKRKQKQNILQGKTTSTVRLLNNWLLSKLPYMRRKRRPSHHSW